MGKWGQAEGDHGAAAWDMGWGAKHVNACTVQSGSLVKGKHRLLWHRQAPRRDSEHDWQAQQASLCAQLERRNRNQTHRSRP